MEITYKSTRSSAAPVTASQAILQGLAGDGGLYVPGKMPHLPQPVEHYTGLSYKELAFEVMKLFLTDFTEEELRFCIDSAYGTNFDTPKIAPVRKAGSAWYLELFHGPTIAFKDMALQILPYLLTTAAKKNDVKEKIVILTATSGDTGKAALKGFADVPGTGIIVFYPKGGVSKIQELQMVTQTGANTAVVRITGNFDDAQTGVKAIFGDAQLAAELREKGYRFSSANSINIGRLIPQIVYYVYAYGQMRREGAIGEGEAINICVPTGNFGNILAAYYAKQIGLPVAKLICASNENNVLFDFFRTGVYDRNRPFILTSSPSMDILVSSNLERLIYSLCGEDPDETLCLMRALSEEGRYEIGSGQKKALSWFYGGYATEKENDRGISELFRETGYIIDTHTGIGHAVYEKYREETGDQTKTLIASTASPFKFAAHVSAAVDPAFHADDEFGYIDHLGEIGGMPVPAAVAEIRNAPVLHDRETSQAGMKDMVEEILKEI